MKNAGGHERWRGARGPFFFQSATLESDVLEFLRSDAGWCQVKAALMAEQDKKQCMSADEQALKRELIYSLMPDDTATGKTLNGQRVIGSCPLKRLVAFNNALKEEMKASADAARAEPAAETCQVIHRGLRRLRPAFLLNTSHGLDQLLRNYSGHSCGKASR